MPHFDHHHLAQWTAGQWTREPCLAVAGFGIDTRRLQGGQMFVAIRTSRRDGHDYLAAAQAAGAAAALVGAEQTAVDLPQLVVADPLAAFHAIAREHRRRFAGPVVGITGSVGKTSTKNLLQGLLGDRSLATAGNLNNTLGVPLTLTRLEPGEHDFAIVEAGISEPGEMEVLATMIEPDQMIVTAVDHAHTRDLGGVEGVATEKARLAAAVKAGGRVYLPAAVAAMEAFQRLPGPVTMVGRAPARTGSVTTGVRFQALHQERETMLRLWDGHLAADSYVMTRVSEGMAQNAVLAIVLARDLGVSSELIKRRLRAWSPGALRGEVRQDQNRIIYLDCYNANPCSMADALESFQARADGLGPRLYILGGMEELGAELDRKHRELGASLQLRETDHVLAIGTGAGAVRAGALHQGARDAQVDVLGDLEGVAEKVAKWPGSIFIKGSRRYQLETVLIARAAIAP